ncbi:hypothetical protein [Sorangium cellulosum]|uniref:hypothetical protein n=1 Tax=Sorangium cellulosum TaxID=56 RepID=UPI000A62F6B1|nr:hypothetical protein [Sorangium cellulosum]
MTSRLRTALAAGVITTSIFTVHEVFAETKDDGLEEQVAACNDNVAYFRSRIDGVVMWSSIFMISGAVISATGSALAGFLNSTSRRKTAAIVGALGAVLTVTPKALPDKEHLLTQLSSAEKHRLVGTKIRNQFQFARPGESLVEAQKYVSARFTDCASLHPPQGVPELPSVESVSLHASSVTGQKPADRVSAVATRAVSATEPPLGSTAHPRPATSAYASRDASKQKEPGAKPIDPGEPRVTETKPTNTPSFVPIPGAASTRPSFAPIRHHPLPRGSSPASRDESKQKELGAKPSDAGSR